MNDDVLVKVEGVSKKFCRDLKRSLWYGIRDIGAELTGRKIDHDHLRKNEFWAVKNVSFELKRGKCLGLIGHNGAGKSTLLKMLNGLIKPDVGTITMKGRIGALIELGAGFNPILTGRENIYINGQILGFSKKEIDAKFDAIVDFAEIEDFIDTPVQNYSSGMKVRLGFAVASQMEPDVLIIDEVLAVGDIGFKLKCFNSIGRLLENSAVILVSHSMPQIARVSTEALMIKKGQVYMKTDNVAKAIEKYYSEFEGSKAQTIGRVVEIKSLKIYSEKGNEDGVVFYDHDMILELILKLNQPINTLNVGITFFDREQKNLASTRVQSFTNKESNSKIKITIPSIQFASGLYTVTFTFSESVENKRVPNFLGRIDSCQEFRVKGAKDFNQSSFILKSYLDDSLFS